MSGEEIESRVQVYEDSFRSKVEGLIAEACNLGLPLDVKVEIIPGLCKWSYVDAEVSVLHKDLVVDFDDF